MFDFVTSSDVVVLYYRSEVRGNGWVWSELLNHGEGDYKPSVSVQTRRPYC